MSDPGDREQGKGRKASWPWHPVAFEDADVFALQALARGNANAAQQLRALDFIQTKICEVDRLEFWPGGDNGRRASDMAGGKRFVALQIRRILNLRPEGPFKTRGAPPAMPAVEPAAAPPPPAPAAGEETPAS